MDSDAERRMNLSQNVTQDLTASLWRISVGGKVYGPYSGQQMRSFVSEGRVAPHSIVATSDAGPWVTATDDPVLANLFIKPQAEPPKFSVVAAPQGEPTGEGDLRSRGANFVIVADIRTRSSITFERELEKLGEFYRLNPLVWVLHTDFPIGQVRNSLTPHLGKTDSLMVVDSTRGKSAWFNLGPEAEAKIRKIWQRIPGRMAV
jgi:hypothetical protein